VVRAGEASGDTAQTSGMVRPEAIVVNVDGL
jgi:hypothetical protein